MSSKKGYVNTSIPLINALFKFKIFIILSNWTFQGMLYADKTERLFRLLLDGIMTLMLYAILINFISSSYIALIFAFLIAHTFNWIFNGQLFVLGRYIGIKPNKHKDFEEYLKGLKYRAERDKSIQSVAAYGSMSRRKLTESSDLDVRIIRIKGFKNGFKACLFGLVERIRALCNKFPLDMYILDNKDKLAHIRKDESPIIVYDSNKALSLYYTKNDR